jgi:Tfp pilus assembly protein PilX
MPSWLIWVIVAILVVLVIIGIAAAGTRKKRERDRSRAVEMREHAAAREPEVRQREARARETAAEADAARAEANRKQAEAERLEAAAEDRHRVAGEAREEHHEHLRKADEVDPDVDHRAATDDQGVETNGVHPSEQRVTHPDGTTETVNDPHER